MKWVPCSNCNQQHEDRIGEVKGVPEGGQQYHPLFERVACRLDMATVGGLNPSGIPIESSKSSLYIWAPDSKVLGHFRRKKVVLRIFKKKLL